MKLSRIIIASLGLNASLLGYLMWTDEVSAPTRKAPALPPRLADIRTKESGERARMADNAIKEIALQVEPTFRVEASPRLSAPALSIAVESPAVDQAETEGIVDSLSFKSVVRTDSPIRTWAVAKAAVAQATIQLPVKLPAVLTGTASKTPATAGQAAALASLREEFVEAIGGTNQNPDDPKYLERWRQALPESDERFKALFGVQAFLERERRTNLLGDSATIE